LICLGLFAAHLVACGDGEKSTPSGHVQRGESEARKIPAADRTAFYAVATVSGSLRLSVAPAAIGQAKRLHDTRGLVAARQRLAALRPRNRQLAVLRTKLRAALADAVQPIRGPDAVRRVARSALRATDLINAGLRSYVRRHPAAAALIPE
jgi:hypothetical protein